jgi:hypothetical protein
MKLTDFPPGTRVYSAKFKTHGTVHHPARTLVHVTMDETQKVRALPVSDLSIVHESRPVREFRETPPKLRSTRFTRKVPQAAENIPRHIRRVRERAAGVRDTSRMMSPSLPE